MDLLVRNFPAGFAHGRAGLAGELFSTLIRP